MELKVGQEAFNELLSLSQKLHSMNPSATHAYNK